MCGGRAVTPPPATQTCKFLFVDVLILQVRTHLNLCIYRHQMYKIYTHYKCIHKHICISACSYICMCSRDPQSQQFQSFLYMQRKAYIAYYHVYFNSIIHSCPKLETTKKIHAQYNRLRNCSEIVFNKNLIKHNIVTEHSYNTNDSLKTNIDQRSQYKTMCCDITYLEVQKQGKGNL